MPNTSVNVDLSGLPELLRRRRATFKMNPAWLEAARAGQDVSLIEPTLDARRWYQKAFGVAGESPDINRDWFLSQAIAKQRHQQEIDMQKLIDSGALNKQIQANYLLNHPEISNLEQYNQTGADFYGTETEIANRRADRELNMQNIQGDIEKKPVFAESMLNRMIAENQYPAVRNFRDSTVDRPSIALTDIETGLPLTVPLDIRPSAILSYDIPYTKNTYGQGGMIMKSEQDLRRVATQVPGSVMGSNGYDPEYGPGSAVKDLQDIINKRNKTENKPEVQYGDPSVTAQILAAGLAAAKDTPEAVAPQTPASTFNAVNKNRNNRPLTPDEIRLLLKKIPTISSIQ